MDSKIINKQQPKSFYMICFLEFWERFGYYGMVGIITYYFVQVMGMGESFSFITYGVFLALCYGYGSIGGYIADKYLGTKRTILIGAFTLLAGYLMLGFSNPHTIYLCLGIVATGNGLFKPNPSSLLSKSYEENDPRLHSGFTWYYMAINIGALLSMTATPYIQQYFDWDASFFFCAAGMFVAILNYIVFKNVVKNIGSTPDFSKLKVHRLAVVIIGTIVISIANAYLLYHVVLAQTLVWIIVGIIFSIYLMFTFKEHSISRKKMIIALVLIVEAIVYFTLYQQMQTSVNFFTIHNVSTTFFGYTIPPLVYQNLNSVVILVFGPILAAIYVNRGRKGKDLKITSKFVLGMFLTALSFLSLCLTPMFSDATGHVSSFWIILFYIFEGPSELLISALGVAMISELVPDKLVGFVMGICFLTSAIGGVTGGILAGLTAVPKGINNAAATLPIYSHVFMQIGIGTLIFTVLMLIIKPLLDKQISNNETV